MKVFILTAMMLMSISCESSGESSFVSNLLIDKDISTIKKKYEGLVKKIECSPSASQLCMEAKQSCSCYQVTLAQTQTLARSIYLITVNNKIHFSSDSTTTQPYLFDSKLETARNIFGDEAPTKIFETQSSIRGFKSIIALWDIDKGFAIGALACPVEKVGGASKIATPIKNCFVHTSKISRLQKFKETEGMTLTDLKY